MTSIFSFSVLSRHLEILYSKYWKLLDMSLSMTRKAHDKILKIFLGFLLFVFVFSYKKFLRNCRSPLSFDSENENLVFYSIGKQNKHSYKILQPIVKALTNKYDNKLLRIFWPYNIQIKRTRNGAILGLHEICEEIKKYLVGGQNCLNVYSEHSL